MQKVISDILVGTDLEMFLYDDELDKIVPCVGVLPGTKDNPFTPAGYPKGFAIQEDNVMVEFNIPPAADYSQFSRSIGNAFIMVLEELHTRHAMKYSLYRKGYTHDFDYIDLRSNQAKTIGCEPDFDAYNGGAERRFAPVPKRMRGCGGHIHLGGDFKCPDFVAALFAELFFSTRCSMVVDPKDPRAKWYGKPGVFRPKPYGIEYRTPSNSWAMSDSNRQYVGDCALRLANWLTSSDPITLQKCFRAVPWTVLREYMLMTRKNGDYKHLKNEIMTKAQNAGVPL